MRKSSEIRFHINSLSYYGLKWTREALGISADAKILYGRAARIERNGITYLISVWPKHEQGHVRYTFSAYKDGNVLYSLTEYADDSTKVYINRYAIEVS